MSQTGSPEHSSLLPRAADPTVHRGTFLAIAACFALSGFAALLYQTAWTRQFALVFGTSDLAVVCVLAAYMAGLAIGARGVDRYLPRVRRPIFVYGFLELGVGLSAIAVPFLLLGADLARQWVLGGQPSPPDGASGGQATFYLVTAFLILAIPTALMGATLPLLTRHVVRTSEEIGSRTGLLYAINTLGAVAGALVAAYLLLPELGLRATVMSGALLNAIVFAIAFTIARSKAVRRTAPLKPMVSPQPEHAPLIQWALPGRHWILAIMLLSGAVAFAYEVLWTRMLGYVLGASVQAYATMVATFLFGIALGSALASRFATSRRLSEASFIVTQIAVAVASAGAYLAFTRFAPEFASTSGQPSLAALAILPASIFIGATFPLAVRILTDDASLTARATARVLAWNTVGAIAGALLAGLVLIPALRFEGTIEVATLTNAVLALLVCLLVARARMLTTAIVACAVAALAVAFRPATPGTLLASSPLHLSSEGTLRYYAEGRSASVVVLEQDGELLLRTNGLPEATIATPGTPPRFTGEYWLSSLAVIARPLASSMLVVGYGGGITVDSAPPSVREIDVIELEPKVIDANRALRRLRARDPLLDERVHVIINDARGALGLTSRTYDAIVSQPSHPWTAGSSHLYTREFLQQARAHLSSGGVFVQWMNISFLDEGLLRSLAATLFDVFHEVRIYRPDPNTLVFLASDSPLDLELAATRPDSPMNVTPRHFARFGIHVTEDLVAALAADQAGARELARGAAPITDDHNRMATAAVYERGHGFTTEQISRVLAQYDPLQRPGSWLFGNRELPLSYAYIARRLALFTSIDSELPHRIAGMARLIPDPSTATYARAIALRATGHGPAALRLLEESVALDSGNQDARFDLVRPWLVDLAHDKAPAKVADIATDLAAPGSTALLAARHIAANEWKEVSELDPVLKTARWIDPWYVDCVQMRADWRVRVSTPELRPRLGREALAMIDDAIVVYATPGLFGLRANSAQAAGRPEVMLESINALAQSSLRMENKEQHAVELRASLQQLIRTLEGMRTDPGISLQRQAEVKSRIEKALRELDAPPVLATVPAS